MYGCIRFDEVGTQIAKIWVGAAVIGLASKPGNFIMLLHSGRRTGGLLGSVVTGLVMVGCCGSSWVDDVGLNTVITPPFNLSGTPLTGNISTPSTAMRNM